MSMSLKNQVAFITGAAHGQGRATAIALAKEGVHIAAFDIAKPLTYPGYQLGSPGDLATLEKEVEALGVTCLPLQGDVRVDAEVKTAVDKCLVQFNHIDI